MTLTLAGHAATLNARPLTQAAVAALLRPQLEAVNMVNAHLDRPLARDRGHERRP